jgi:hypothetical protein
MATTIPATAPSATDQMNDIGFSVHELQYLLSIAPGDSADRSAELLNVGPVPSVDETILVGGASLLSSARLEISDDGSFRPLGAALIVAFILSSANRWTFITGGTDESVDAGVFVESPSGGLLAQPRTLGTWWFVLLDPAADPAQVLVDTAVGMADTAAHAGVTVRTATTSDDRTFSLRRQDGDWGYGFGPSDSDVPTRLVESTTRETVVDALRSFGGAA